MERGLGLPISTREPWNKSWTIRFLLRHQARIETLGYRTFVGFRDRILRYEGVGRELIDYCNDHGILWYWHPPMNTAFGIGKTGKLTDHLKAVGEAAGELVEKGMRYLLIHPDAAYPEAPPAETGPERYNSRMSSSQMMRFMENHIQPGYELSAMCDWRLLWENVHDCLYGKMSKGRSKKSKGCFTYYAAQTGYLELPWLAHQTFAGTGFDSEHYYGSLELHWRRGIYRDLPVPPSRQAEKPDDRLILRRLVGYYLLLGYPPYREWKERTLEGVMETFKPKICHLGGGTSLVNAEAQNTGHISFDLRRPSQRQILLHDVAYVEKHGGWLEAENEGRERNPAYSPRIESDRQAKKKCFWQAVKAIEKYRAGLWRPESEFII